MSATPDVAGRLIAVACALSGKGEDAAWLSQAIFRFAFGEAEDIPSALFGVSTEPGQRSSSAKLRLGLRDKWLQAAAARLQKPFAGGSRAAALAEEIRWFECRVWPGIEAAAPPADMSELRQFLLYARRVSRKPLPQCTRRLETILARPYRNELALLLDRPAAHDGPVVYEGGTHGVDHPRIDARR